MKGKEKMDNIDINMVNDLAARFEVGLSFADFGHGPEVDITSIVILSLPERVPYCGYFSLRQYESDGIGYDPIRVAEAIRDWIEGHREDLRDFPVRFKILLDHGRCLSRLRDLAQKSEEFSMFFGDSPYDPKGVWVDFD